MGHLIEKYKIAFIDDSFVEQLNKNGNEIPFKNVIINLKSFEFTEKTSYNNNFTHTVDLNYDQHTKSQRFSRFIKNIMPNKKDRAFLFYTLSKCISYDTDNSVATWFTGKGKNGISVLMFLFQELMGQFCVTRTHSIFNHPKINKENKNLNELYLKRACIIQENFLETFPEEGFTKLTECDKIIFDKNDKTKDTLHQIKTKFLFISRTPPNTTKSEFIFSKIRILHFPVSFVDNPSNENQKQIDRSILSKLNKERHKIAFMNILLKYYKKYHSINSKNFDDRDYFIHNNERRKDFTSFLDEFMIFEKGWGTTNEAIWELFKHFKKGDIQIKRDEIKKRIENYICLTIFSENYAKGELVYVNKRITTEQEIHINSRSIKIDMKKGEQQSAKKTKRMWLNLRITYNSDR